MEGLDLMGVFGISLESELEPEEFVYRLSLARLGKMQDFTLWKREVRAKLTPNSAGDMALVNRDSKVEPYGLKTRFGQQVCRYV